MDTSESTTTDTGAGPSHPSDWGILRSGPTVLAAGALIALGYWGHHTGWKVPKFSELIGHAARQDADWCSAHAVPASICVACNADLMPKGRLTGWCPIHGVAECVMEHPETAQVKPVPTISQADHNRANRALAARERPKNDPLCKLHLRRIQFTSLDAVEKAGTDIDLVDRGPIVESVASHGRITYDPTRVARLASRAAGTVWRVEKNVGDRVRQHELLALVDAADVGRAKANLLQAVAQLDLQDKTLQRLASLEHVVAGRRMQETEAARAEALASVRKAVRTLSNLGLPITLDGVRGTDGEQLSRQLRFLGMPPALADTLDPRTTTANLIPVVAPRDGVVVDRNVVAGEVVDVSRPLFTIVDIRRMWLLLDVALEEVRYLALGQKVIFRPAGDSDDHVGHITWISTDVDADTRTVTVRAELPNDDGRLRNENFGSGRIVLREEEDAIVVPMVAIHWEGCCHVAFVRDEDFLEEDSYKVFHTRMVRPGITHGDVTEVIAGLLPGEVIATRGSGLLRAELLKGNLGAG